jgi:DNA invertase Pin-like site-specific DNA recombinase
MTPYTTPQPTQAPLDKPRRQRCAIYTRKSSEDGLEQEFNSLHAQREACEAYIASQRSEGWALVREHYDDGGISGGTLERPALQQLLQDVEAGLIDVIVVYKIDRLSRSLTDFSKLVDIFDRNGVTFVSVTQSFNTTNSMGRLTLNILLSFAQFEREVTAERIRDKFAASRKKGLWMGGNIPFGYDLDNRKLRVNPQEAAILRHIFERFVEIGSATVLVKDIRARGIVGKKGRPFDKGALYRMLRNRLYLGEAVHKGTSYPGEHDAIIDQALWDKVHSTLEISPRKRALNTRTQTPSLLKGLIYTAHGVAMTPASTKKGNRRYRYYVSMDLIKTREPMEDDCPTRLPAGTVEGAVIRELRRIIRAPETAAQVIMALSRGGHDYSEPRVVSALQQFDDLWKQLFPGEQARIIQLLVRKVTVTAKGLIIDIRAEGIADVLRDMMVKDQSEAA